MADMAEHKNDFLELALARGVLKFGEFTLKSGRISPYFFNLGAIDSGRALHMLARMYARTLIGSGIQFDMLFGPAYKGIPLVAAVAAALSESGLDIPFAYNRKEAKDHGEGGLLVGAKPQGRVVIIDDVITAGTAVREAIHLLRNAGAQPTALLIALDRQERLNDSPQSAVQALEAQEQLRVLPIVGLDDVMAFLASRPDEDAAVLETMRSYRKTYGV